MNCYERLWGSPYGQLLPLLSESAAVGKPVGKSTAHTHLMARDISLAATWADEARPAATNTAPADLHVSTVDDQGRLALRGPALTMGWMPGQDLALNIRDGGIRLSNRSHQTPTGSSVGVTLDRRFRVLIPYGIRVHGGWKSGVRVMVLAVPVEGVVAALSVPKVVSAFLRVP
jgi:hypothetical protein